MHLQSLKLLRPMLKMEMHLQEKNNLILASTQNVAQYPLRHVIYTSAKFEVAMFNSLGKDTITRKV